jgi:hypothetical protein
VKCGAHCPGITIQGFLPAMDTATDTLIGNTELVYAVGADKEGQAVSVIRQPVGVNAGLIAPCARSTCSTRGRLVGPRCDIFVRQSPRSRTSWATAHVRRLSDESDSVGATDRDTRGQRNSDLFLGCTRAFPSKPGAIASLWDPDPPD